MRLDAFKNDKDWLSLAREVELMFESISKP